MNKKKTSKKYLRITYVVAFLFALGYVIAYSWTGFDISYSGNEDTPYIHNFSANVTGATESISFNVDIVNTNITWNAVKVNYSEISSWIFFLNQDTGEFIFNATTDNMTGAFRIPIKATDGEDISAKYFNFTILAK